MLFTPNEVMVMRRIHAALLPNPASVKPEYYRFQYFCAVQGVCSSILGLFASKAMLKSLGVGDAKSTAGNALFVQIVQETVGRLTTILFGSYASARMNANLKVYRFSADILMDLAFALDLVTVYLPTTWFIVLACFSNALKAAVGIAVNTKPVITAAQVTAPEHLAEVTTKNTSQETACQLFSTAIGAGLMHIIPEGFLLWSAMLLLFTVHLSANHAAVRSVVMDSINPQRAWLIAQHYIRTREIPTPFQIAMQESIIPWPTAPWNKASRYSGSLRKDEAVWDTFFSHCAKQMRHSGDAPSLEELQKKGWNTKFVIYRPDPNVESKEKPH